MLEDKALPPFILCIWGIIRIWTASPLDFPHSVLKASQSVVLLVLFGVSGFLRVPSRVLCSGEMRWPNNIENPVDVPFNLWGLWCHSITLFLCLL